MVKVGTWERALGGRCPEEGGTEKGWDGRERDEARKGGLRGPTRLDRSFQKQTPSTRAPAHFQTSLWPKPPGVTEPGTGAAAPMPSGNII